MKLPAQPVWRPQRGVRLVGTIAFLLAVNGWVAAQVPLFSTEGSGTGDMAGYSVALLGDLDGDGRRDFVVGAPSDALGTGTVTVHSGEDGTLLFTLGSAAVGDRFGCHVASAGDVNADGLDDIAVGASQANPDWAMSGWAGDGPGYAQVFSGADGSLLHTWQGEYGIEVHFNSFGRRVLGVGDWNGDGYDDVAVAEREAEVERLHDLEVYGGRVTVYSGLDGTELRRLENYGTFYGHLGWSLAGGQDFDGDGTPDLLMGAPIGLSSSWPARVVVVSGATGVLLQSVSSTGHLGYEVGFLADVDADDVPDFVASDQAQIRGYSGATGTLLYQSAVQSSLGPYTGLPVAVIADHDGDDINDYAIGVPASLGLGPSAGKVRIYSGTTGHMLFVLVGSQATAKLGFALAGTADYDGDGQPELLIGEPTFDGVAGMDSGRVGLYSARAPKLHLGVYSPNPTDLDFGQRVAALGDVNNDGWGDLGVGLPSDSATWFQGGRVQVFSGRDGELLLDLAGAGINDRFGWCVSAAGDLNGDGYDDVLAGAPFTSGGAGPAYARAFSGRDGTLLHHFDGHTTNDQFGIGVAAVGDLDGDGRGDLAIGAPNDTSTVGVRGKVYIYSASTGAELMQLHGPAQLGGYGSAVAAAGDCDDDGVPDILVGAPSATTANGISSGLARVYSGASGSLLHEVLGPTPADQAGSTVLGLGDVNGDGHDDFAVGIPFAPDVTDNAGVVQVRSGASGALLFTAGGESGDAPYGQAMALAGDVNGDGVMDFAVGVRNSDVAEADAGAVRVHSGSNGELLLLWPGYYPGNFAGWSVSAQGDIDNDGSHDLVLGAYGSTEDPGPAGSAYIVNPEPITTPWRSAGKKLPGQHGAPVLTGSGSLISSEPVTLALQGALENSSSTLILGFTALEAPFKGGTMVPFPHVLFFGLPTGPLGEIVVVAPWPASIPSGFSLYAQHWIVDPAGLAGFAASNAVVGTVP